MNVKVLSPGWLLANAVTLGAFLYLFSLFWAPRGEEGLCGGPGDASLIGLTAIPMLLLGAITNVAWVIVILVRVSRGASWRALVMPLLVLAVWGVGVEYAFSRMYVGCN